MNDAIDYSANQITLNNSRGNKGKPIILRLNIGDLAFQSPIMGEHFFAFCQTIWSYVSSSLFAIFTKEVVDKLENTQNAQNCSLNIYCYLHPILTKPISLFFAVGGTMGGKTQRRTSENWSSRRSMCCTSRGFRCRTQEENGCFRNQNEANHH